jgi:hypothetical protein
MINVMNRIEFFRPSIDNRHHPPTDEATRREESEIEIAKESLKANSNSKDCDLK